MSDYLNSYAEYVNDRVDRDPHAAAGGMWNVLARLQFDFLVSKGLKPGHSMLDIGCGTLRGGRLFIKYLDVGNYCGTDIAYNAIWYSRRFVKEKGLLHKEPRLIVNVKKNLRFRDFNGETFDYILAQSVFTHLKPRHIKECFSYIDGIMHSGSLFYFTFFYAGTKKRVSGYKFKYPFLFFKDLAKMYGFVLEDVSSEYMHPRGQWMIEVRKK